MDTAGFVTSLATSFSVFCLLLLVYEIMSRQPSNYLVYYPLRIMKGWALPDHSKPWRPFMWVKEAWKASEEDIVHAAGLDGAVYLSLFETSLQILACSALYCLPVLIPLSATSHNYKNLGTESNAAPGGSPSSSYGSSSGNTTVIQGPSFSGFDRFAMGNISEHDLNRIWAFLLGGYWLSIVTYIVLWRKYKHIMKHRNSLLSSQRAQSEDFTVLVLDIPYHPDDSPIGHEKQVNDFFKKLYPESYERCLIVMKLNKASEFWKELEDIKKKLAQYQARFLLSKSKTPGGIRPQHRTGFLGLWGPKVDSIKYFKKKVEILFTKLDKEKSKIKYKIKGQGGAAFIFFRKRTTAALAAQAIHAPHGNVWRTMPAPQPKDVLWTGLMISLYGRLIRKAVVYIIVFLTILFYMIPVALISAVTTLDNLESALPFLKSVVKIRALNAILEGYLPQVALTVFLALLPTFLRYLSKLEGYVSRSNLIRATSEKYFYFVIFNVFLGVTLGTTLFNPLKKLKNNMNFDSVVLLLGSSLPPAASFFITYISLKLFIGYGLEVSRVISLLLYYIKKQFICKTEEELREASNPGPFKYHRYVPNDMLVVTIALCYAVIAPMVLPFAMLYFLIGWFVMRNQALNVYVPSFDSKGCFWPHIHVRMLVALLVSQLTLLGYFTIKKFLYTFLLLPLPAATLLFYYLCRTIFDIPFRVTPLVCANDEVKEMPSMEEIVKAYTPSCLLQEDDNTVTPAHKNDNSPDDDGNDSKAEKNAHSNPHIDIEKNQSAD